MKLFKVLNTDSVEGLNVNVGDIVKLVEVSSSDNILMQCVPHRTCTTWAIPQIWFYASQLEAVHTDSEQGTLPACNEPVSSSNGEGGTLVPSEANEASTAHSVPSTSVDKDKRKYRFVPKTYADGTLDHYRLMASMPIRLDPALEHAAKKLLFPGQRGAKDELQDLREVIKSVQVYIDYKTAQTERDH